ncbi:hypothetical protein [Streptomyces mirabilis]|uniref:hypothetical protein n=1 Tax=Streptomyces mirabilis TaxID=68239 RepID=UPI0036BF6E81
MTDQTAHQPLTDQQLDEIEADRAILRAAPGRSDDWDDATWGAWWRTAERVHGDAPAPVAAVVSSAAGTPGNLR